MQRKRRQCRRERCHRLPFALYRILHGSLFEVLQQAILDCAPVRFSLAPRQAHGVNTCAFVVVLRKMAVSPALSARRVLIKVMLSLATLCSVLLSLSRDATDAEVRAGYKKLVRKVHPDKGGKTEDAQNLQVAKDMWDDAKEKATPGGRLRQSGARSANAGEEQQADNMEVADPEQARKAYRIQSGAVLLTCSGVRDLAQWRRF